MSQTYFLPVPFVRFQDPSSRSDAPTGGGSAGQTGGQTGGNQNAGTTDPNNPQTGKQNPQACGGDSMLWMMAAMLPLMYFMIWRPEQKRKKEQQTLLSSIKQGDKVVTISGMHGVVSSLTDKTVTLTVDTVNMTFDRSAVARIEREPAAESTPQQGS